MQILEQIPKLLQFLENEKVEYKALYEITIWDKKFKDVPKEWQEKIVKFKHISAQLLKSLQSKNGTIKLLSTGKFTAYTTTELAESYLNENEVISIPSGGSANIKYHNGKFVDSGNILAISKDREKYNLKFIYYFLLLQNDTIQSHFRGSVVAHPEMKAILSLPIPLPPLEIQNTIVEILDNFTELNKALEKELELRKKQYEYYRNLLLSKEELEKRTRKLFCKDSLNTTDKEDSKNDKYKDIYNKNEEDIDDSQLVKMVKLGEVFHIKNGYTPSTRKKEYWENGTIPWFRMEDIRKNGRILKDSIQHITPQAVRGGKLFPANSILIATTATIGEHALAIVDCLGNQRFTFLTPKSELLDSINMKFMFYYGFILGEYCKENVNVSGFASVDMSKFKNFQIPLPPLEIQNEIVEILDNFDALINDLNQGIPAEISLRRQQYEYYREKLLSFKEVRF